MKQVSKEHVRMALIRRTREFGSVSEFARKTNISRPLVSKTRRHDTHIPPVIAEALGFWVRGYRFGAREATYWVEDD